MTPTVIAIAELIRKTFPELDNRAFAIMEAVLTKENVPRLPLAFIALENETAVDTSKNSTPIEITENIIVEFWLKPVIHKKSDGSQSPFYAFQDYYPTRDKLLTALRGFFSSDAARIRYISLNVHSDEFAIFLQFKFSCTWRWCPEPDNSAHPNVQISFCLDPESIPYLVPHK